MPDLVCEWCDSIDSVKVIMDGRVPIALCKECRGEAENGCDCDECTRERKRFDVL